MKRFALSGIVGWAILMISSGLFYMVIFKSQVEEGMKAFGSVANTNPNMGLVLLNNVIQALMTAYLFERVGVNTWKSGIKTGVLVGATLSVWVDVWMFYSVNCITMNKFAIDLIIHTATFVYMSLAIVFVRMRMRSVLA